MNPAGPAGNGAAIREWITGKILPLILWSIPLASELLTVARLSARLAREGAERGLLLELANRGLTLAFFVLVLAAYLTRWRARSAARGFRERVVPMVIFLASPAGIALLHFFPPDRQFEADGTGVLLGVAGLGISLWSLAHLRRSFSILAEARQVVASGPYRFVRHPLYLGEAITMLGLCLKIGAYGAIIFWAVVNGFQLLRARIEEDKLSREFAEYRAYRQRTRFILPGIY